MTRPENWVVIKIENPKEKDPLVRTIYKVFASWAGGYLDGDAWKINSGIDRITEDEYTFKFYGYSGSCYICQKGTYGTGTSFSTGVLTDLIKKVEERGATMTILPEDTDWVDL
jgi:hypothetical protein